MVWLNLEGIGNKKRKKYSTLKNALAVNSKIARLAPGQKNSLRCLEMRDGTKSRFDGSVSAGIFCRKFLRVTFLTNHNAPKCSL
jgi:hypothetical protein